MKKRSFSNAVFGRISPTDTAPFTNALALVKHNPAWGDLYNSKAPKDEWTRIVRQLAKQEDEQ